MSLDPYDPIPFQAQTRDPQPTVVVTWTAQEEDSTYNALGFALALSLLGLVVLAFLAIKALPAFA